MTVDCGVGLVRGAMDGLFKQVEQAFESEIGQKAVVYLDSESGNKIIEQAVHTVVPGAQADMAAKATKGFIHSHNRNAGQQPGSGGQIQPQTEAPVPLASQGQFGEPQGPPPGHSQPGQFSQPSVPHSAQEQGQGQNALMGELQGLAAGFLKR
ncbi:hypothetical protein BC830DRAFT_1081716 [Chytriomyces sp. MP71]|nr:hypothetical protein BC830DRAFT_1081716 [Chytriomyces sp. MP71]